MIVCHCNVICSERIRSAVHDALAELPGSAITPAQVYARCSAIPDCGGCKSKIRQIIDDIANGKVFMAAVDHAAADDTATMAPPPAVP